MQEILAGVVVQSNAMLKAQEHVCGDRDEGHCLLGEVESSGPGCINRSAWRAWERIGSHVGPWMFHNHNPDKVG